MVKDPRDEAEHALGDLNMAGAIEALCEHSLFRTAAGHRFEQRIARLCRDHMQLQLKAYDRARARLTNPPPVQAASAVEQRDRDDYARLVEGDSDNPLRVAKANRIYVGEYDDEVAQYVRDTAITSLQDTPDAG